MPMSVKARSPVSDRVKCHLRAELGSRWKAGTRLPPIVALAQELGVGQRSAHQAVRELVADGLLISRPGLGTLVAPRLSHCPLASAGAIDPSRIVGREGRRLAGRRVAMFTVATSPEEIIVRMMEAAGDALAQQGATVEQRAIHPSVLGKLDTLPLDAVMVFNPDTGVPIVASGQQNVVVVNTGLDAPPIRARHFDVVSVDQEQGGQLIGQYVRDQGYQEVCYLGVIGRSRRQSSGRLDRTSQERLHGLERGLGRSVPGAHVIVSANYAERDGARAVAAWRRLESRPPVVIAASDELAMGFICGGEALELQPGRDYQIIGFDGQRPGRKMPDGPLTTVNVPAEAMGRASVELLAERFMEPGQPTRRLHLGCELERGRTLLSAATVSASLEAMTHASVAEAPQFHAPRESHR